MNRIRIGAFDLYPAERRLLAGDAPVELGARAFDMLVVLAEQAGRLVTKATLLERVWPKLIVDENNLPAQVASLRRALGAGAISTVPGFGYRLELPVSSEAAPASVPSAVLAPTAEPRRRVAAQRTWPDRLGPLIGRDLELRQLQESLAEVSLVSLVGVAGAGKTRLAREILALEEMKPDAAVAWVALQPISDLAHLPSAIARSLGVALPSGNTESFDALGQLLRDAPALLILDGAEHLAHSLATPLTSLLLHTRGLRTLVTSQVPIGIASERVHRLPVLPVPRAGATHSDASEHAAVQLFAQRAAAADRGFRLTSANCAQIAEICRRLDGNPLALELAAARVPSLGVSALLERLDDRFRLLKHAAQRDNPRHSTLHAAFDWSYGLLSAHEQRVFAGLGVFAGSFSLDAGARAVADETIDVAEAVDLIARLVDRSLVTAIPADPPRYTLSETARFYACERLDAAQSLASSRRRLAITMLHVLDIAYQDYWAVDEAVWISRYEPDLANVRAAIDWAGSADGPLAVALYGSAWPLFIEADLQAEVRARFEQVVVRLNDAVPRARVGRFWEAVASYESACHWDRARYAAELAAASGASTHNPRAEYYAQMLLAINCRGDADAARAAYRKAMRLEDPAWPARLLALGAQTEGALATAEGQYAVARLAYARGVRHALVTSEREALAATVAIVELDIANGDMAAALQLARPLVASLRNSSRRNMRFDVTALAMTALLLGGEIAEARELGAELLQLAIRGDSSRLYCALDAMAYLACLDGHCDLAAQIAMCADQAIALHGLTARRPADCRLREALTARLDASLGAGWLERVSATPRKLDEIAACSLALGLRA